MAAPLPSPDMPPALVARHGSCSLLTPDGEVLTLAAEEAVRELRAWPAPLVVHAPLTARRLGLPPLPQPTPWLDLLELFTFVLPGRTIPPTVRGLAQALDLDDARIGAAEADLLPELADILLDRAAALRMTPAGEDMAALAIRMDRAGWAWGGSVLAALGAAHPLPPEALQPGDAIRVWRRLPRWEDTAPRPAPANHPVSAADARRRLGEMLGPQAESRAGQADFAGAASAAFAPRLVRGDPHMVLAEAGTGTGKTLGYVAPASLWAERNGGAVWISTYTRHLQRQIEGELSRLYPDPAVRRRHVVLRKGRENYLCLLNMEEAVNMAGSRGGPSGAIIGLSLVARWAGATADGDLLGGDLPGWFGDLFGRGLLAGIADRRGECIHGACPHYQRCFVEHSIRRAREADLVIANHALVMAQAAWHAMDGESGADEDNIPTRYVFDEGHHVMDAADSAFSTELSGLEAAELRRWLLGAEGARSRARGLKRRLDDLVVGQPRLEAPLEAVLQAAHALPPPGWSARLADALHPVLEPVPQAGEDEAMPALAGPVPAAPVLADATLPNPCEWMLHLLARQVLARSRANEPGHTGHRGGAIECDLHPLSDALPAAAAALARALDRLAVALRTLVERLLERLEDDTGDLDSATRERIEAAVRTLRRRALSRVEGWVAMLRAIGGPEDGPGGMAERGTPQHIDFIRLDRREGQRPGEQDVGLHRHWLDPTIPFAAVLAAPAHGILTTSATLRDENGRGDGDEAERAWEAAEARTGASHLPSPALRAAVASPFDYRRQSRAFIVNDVAHDDIGALAGAYRTLFQAAGGGGLGLFTAISRLRAVHQRLSRPLEDAGIPLYAQHVDGMDNATLVDIFRSEANSCLLGTDAMRDGVDVPGRSLRLVVFERVPWPRPDILHRERRTHLSRGQPGEYDDRIARLRLRQAFGRLIRSSSDRGVFVLLDRRAPSRLLSAFPEGVAVRRAGLGEVARDMESFLRGHENGEDGFPPSPSFTS
ncbi:helicase c2 [Gluconacetobacter diazotrophicus PA1 5]|uniref:ATP-dependent DNA helicase n=1 Tax=Gluconacetobacter diazotrophicus TaxID=33996 RepID=UPI000173C97F|nr:ATP-dependent DNA helicase [Gluconacetobacter diazotrophicus]ACI50066.1 helicase c2 [Gluconacetobacter diazotrophicus PA1 5]TWB07854.1 ATP-dependent DNA helicase DinG [Gluconacetobacter diazotrophicus]